MVTVTAALATGMAIAYVNSWKLAWVLTLAFPFVLLGGFAEVSLWKSDRREVINTIYYQIYTMIASSDKKRETLISANIVATEAISNIRTVAAYGNEPRMLQKYGNELVLLKGKPMKDAAMLGGLTGFGQFGVMASNALGI